MSASFSPSSGKPYGLALVTVTWRVPRATVYRHRARRQAALPSTARRGPKTALKDEALLEAIRGVLTASPFLGEGHRKVWARLRAQGVRTSKARCLRLMREAGLLAPGRSRRVLGPRNHDGTITTEAPDVMWGTDATCTVTTLQGQATVFIAVDQDTAECVGIHAAKVGTRFERPSSPFVRASKPASARTAGAWRRGCPSATTMAASTPPTPSRTSCASWAPSPVRPSSAVPRVTAAPSASSALSRSNCSGGAPSPPWRNSGWPCWSGLTGTTSTGVGAPQLPPAEQARRELKQAA